MEPTTNDPDPEVQAPPTRPFSQALFEALNFEASQVLRADVSIGARSQSVTLKFALTTDQVEQLEAMANQA